MLKSTGKRCCKPGNDISRWNSENIFSFVSAGQKKKKRKSRWSSGIYVRRKNASPHTSREDAHLATDEEEDNGDEDEDAERGGKEQMAMGVESVSTLPQGGRRRRDGQERWVKSSNTAEDEVSTCENSQRQHNGEKLDTVDAKKQMEKSKNGMEGTGNDTGEADSVDNSQESRTGIGRGTWERSSSGKLVHNETEKFTETGNKIVNVAEEEPMLMPGTTETVREDPSTGEMVSSRDSDDTVYRKSGENDGVCVHISERLARCMIRAKKNAMMQQRTNNVSKALQTLEQETPVVVDRDKLKVPWKTAGVIQV